MSLTKEEFLNSLREKRTRVTVQILPTKKEKASGKASGMALPLPSLTPSGTPSLTPNEYGEQMFF